MVLEFCNAISGDPVRLPNRPWMRLLRRLLISPANRTCCVSSERASAMRADRMADLLRLVLSINSRYLSSRAVTLLCGGVRLGELFENGELDDGKG